MSPVVASELAPRTNTSRVPFPLPSWGKVRRNGFSRSSYNIVTGVGVFAMILVTYGSNFGRILDHDGKWVYAFMLLTMIGETAAVYYKEYVRRGVETRGELFLQIVVRPMFEPLMIPVALIGTGVGLQHGLC